MLKPMLACDAPSFADIRFPLFASPKLDGVRATIQNGIVLSRSLKPIRNKYVQSVLGGRPELEGLDGELIVGSPTAPNVMQATTSGVMSVDGEPDFTFYVFDTIEYFQQETYKERITRISESKKCKRPVVFLCATLLETHEQLLRAEEYALEAGYEGLILRDPDGMYKHGRSTSKEQGMLKIKRFADGEAKILWYDELYKNNNVQEQDERGYAKRSTAAAGMVRTNTIGALVVSDLKTGVIFSIGSGFTAAQRACLWGMRWELQNKIVKYKYFPIGVKDAPRFPVFLGFRDADDLGE